jgi:UDP-3-O-[3-hydroxymyristoyl] glucosamine N-acyltransferase
MPDPRFYRQLGPLTLGEVMQLANGRVSGVTDPLRSIEGVAILDQAGAQTITFLSRRQAAEGLAAGRAGYCFVTEALLDLVPRGCIAVIVADPQLAYALTAERLHAPRQMTEGAISKTARLEDGAHLSPGVAMGPDAQVGEGSRIGANSVLGPGVTLGRGCEIGPNVTIGFALIGDGVKISAGAVIGEAGFGATSGPKGLVDIPQLGRVIIQDGVTIGANSTIDRGAFDDTVIGENTKIDNLVHIAHNVRIGRNCVMAAYTGISGSVLVGDNVQFGGRAGVVDHVSIGPGARIGAGAAVTKDVPAGETWSGGPARPLRRWLRETAWVARMSQRENGAGK